MRTAVPGWVVAFLTAAWPLGCTGVNKPMPRWLVVSDPRVEIPLGQTSATATVGDSVYLEVGRIEFDPDSKGYTAFVDGRRVAHPEWDTKDADLRFRYRAKQVGTYRIEVKVPRADSGDPTVHTCAVTVIE